jgi:hypothetical protein
MVDETMTQTDDLLIMALLLQTVRQLMMPRTIVNIRMQMSVMLYMILVTAGNTDM